MRFDEMTAEQRREMSMKAAAVRKANRATRPAPKYCNRGHKLEGNNIVPINRKYWNAQHTEQKEYATYRCRKCGNKYSKRHSRAAREKRRDALLGERVPVCRRGHAVTGDNVRLSPRRRVRDDGSVHEYTERTCRTCERINHGAKGVV